MVSLAVPIQLGLRPKTGPPSDESRLLDEVSIEYSPLDRADGQALDLTQRLS